MDISSIVTRARDQVLDRKTTGRHIGTMINMSVAADGMTAKLLVNDYHVRQVGGTPPYTILLALRNSFVPKSDKCDTDTLLLLRVTGRATAPSDSERERILDQYYKAKPHADGLWGGAIRPKENEEDEHRPTDPFTHSELQFGGLECDILGTLYPGEEKNLLFSSDVEYSVNACMYDVIRPTGDLLSDILDVIRKSTAPKNKNRADFGLKGADGVMNLGEIRYSSTQFLQKKTDNKCPVYLDPMELIGNRTGVFGMSRSGKSNLIKILMTTMHTAYQDSSSRMGQLVFDVNGEYANTNKQDGGSVADTLFGDAVCMKAGGGSSGKCIEYLPNFYYDLALGFRMLKKVLKEQGGGGESEAFKVLMTVSIPEPSAQESLAMLSWDDLLKRVAFRALLYKSGFAFIEPTGKNDKGCEDLMRWVASEIEPRNGRERVAREVIVYYAKKFKDDKRPPHVIFEEHAGQVFKKWKEYTPTAGIDTENLDKGTGAIVSLVTDYSESTKRNMSGSGYFVMAHAQHSAHGRRPFQQVSQYLEEGKLVIIDLSGSTPSARASFMEEQATYIFNEYNNRFINDEERRALLIYIEEAHNMLGVSAKADDIWPRIAKEGAKMNIGLVFATQEPSSIQSNILKNTDNFIALHMNNSAEASFMGGYGFGRFVDHIQRVTDIGYVRIKQKNIPFAYPCQIRKFDVSDPVFDSYREKKEIATKNQTPQRNDTSQNTNTPPNMEEVDQLPQKTHSLGISHEPKQNQETAKTNPQTPAFSANRFNRSVKKE